uniref:Uncharacterized protein n=1 Tax=Setaria italica TaxID=4555 RepID=K4ANV8_SETIT
MRSASASCRCTPAHGAPRHPSRAPDPPVPRVRGQRG